MTNPIEYAKRWLRSRRLSYLRTFDANNVDAQEVLADLARFCRAHDSTFHPQHAARLDGRREVWLRIQHHLQLTDDQLWQLYGRKDLKDA
jgi:hypothetical protein